MWAACLGSAFMGVRVFFLGSLNIGTVTMMMYDSMMMK